MPRLLSTTHGMQNSLTMTISRSTSALLCVAATLFENDAHAAAPSFEAFGAFFPAWMLCASVGILGAIVARAVLLRSGLSAVLPYQLLVCTAAGLIVALLVWLPVFG